MIVILFSQSLSTQNMFNFKTDITETNRSNEKNQLIKVMGSIQ